MINTVVAGPLKVLGKFPVVGSKERTLYMGEYPGIQAVDGRRQNVMLQVRHDKVSIQNKAGDITSERTLPEDSVADLSVRSLGGLLRRQLRVKIEGQDWESREDSYNRRLAEAQGGVIKFWTDRLDPNADIVYSGLRGVDSYVDDLYAAAGRGAQQEAALAQVTPEQREAFARRLTELLFQREIESATLINARGQSETRVGTDLFPNTILRVALADAGLSQDVAAAVLPSHTMFVIREDKSDGNIYVVREFSDGTKSLEYPIGKPNLDPTDVCDQPALGLPTQYYPPEQRRR